MKEYIIKYQGNKRKELNNIGSFQPKKFNTFVDVFGGGGSVSLYYHKKGVKVHYNDKDIGLFELVNAIKTKETTEELLLSLIHI